MIPEQPTKILVAMSGGVDSSVAAALLRSAGHEVVGVFMRLGSPGDALEELIPGEVDMVELHAVPPPLVAHQAETDLFGITLPLEWGGLG